MPLKVIPNYLTALHHEADALQLGDVADRISSYGDQVGEFSRLNCADAVLPAQHFCGIRGDGAKHIERRHSRIAQLDQGPSARLPARLSRIKPTHVRASGELHARLQHSLDQLIVALFTACIATGSVSAGGGRDDYARFGNFQVKAVVE